jgi:hypothetical protein
VPLERKGNSEEQVLGRADGHIAVPKSLAVVHILHVRGCCAATEVAGAQAEAKTLVVVRPGAVQAPEPAVAAYVLVQVQVVQVAG